MSIPYDDIAACFRDGTVIPFLGAGASTFHRTKRRPKPPSGANLALEFAEKARVRRNPQYGAVPCLQTLSCPHSSLFAELADAELRDLARMASAYEFIKRDRSILNRYLRDRFSGPFGHNILHELIATAFKRKPGVVITTNYDTMLESAFDGCDSEYHLISTHIDIRNETILTRHRSPSGTVTDYPDAANMDFEPSLPIIYKIHGTIDRDRIDGHSFVVTEEDYADLIQKIDLLVPSAIVNKLADYQILFLGHGLTDWTLRVVLANILFRGRLGRRAHWAVQRNPSPLEQTLWEKRGIDLFRIGLASFTAKLQKELRATSWI